QLIRVKEQPPTEITACVTRHGPTFLAHRDKRLALKWTAAQPGLLQYPMLDLDRAGNWQEFQAAIKRLSAPRSNFVYADVEGNIGYHAVGALPKRKAYRSDLPVDGSSSVFEW